MGWASTAAGRASPPIGLPRSRRRSVRRAGRDRRLVRFRGAAPSASSSPLGPSTSGSSSTTRTSTCHCVGASSAGVTRRCRVGGAPCPLGVDRRRFRPRPLLQRPEPAPRARPAPGPGAVTRAVPRFVRGDRFVRRARSASDVQPSGLRAGARCRRIPCAGLPGASCRTSRQHSSPGVDGEWTAGQRRAQSSPQTAEGDDARACWATRAMSGAMVAAVSI